MMRDAAPRRPVGFVYFDVGGVAVADFSGTQKWEEMLKELGVKTPAARDAFEALWDRYEPALCCGQDVDTLLPLLREQLRLPVPPGYSLLRAIVSKFAPNPALWPVVAEVQRHARVGLLTNMYPRMLATIEREGILPPGITWDEIIDSSVEHCLKPEPAIYELAERRAGVAPGRLLFIDNSEPHLAAAQARGWQTFWYDAAAPGHAAQELADLLAGASWADRARQAT